MLSRACRTDLTQTNLFYSSDISDCERSSLSVRALWRLLFHSGGYLLRGATLLLIPVLLGACRSIERSHIQIGSTDRSYYVRLPDGYSPNHKYPLVIQLHGGGGNAETAESMSKMTELARKRGFVVVYPDGFGPRMMNALKTWNAGHCCGRAMRENSDDVAFISELIDFMIQNYSIDSRRIYLCGMSNGAMMTYRAAQKLAPRLAGIGIVAGAMFGDESVTHTPVPVMIIHGRKDDAVPFEGGRSEKDLVSENMEGTFASVEYAAGFWAQNNGCSGARSKQRTGPANAIEQWSYSCPADYPVLVYALDDGGHSWPGGEKGRRAGDDPVPYFNASEKLLDFFAAHRR